MVDNQRELWDLLNALCENQLTHAQAARLEEIVLASTEARWLFLTYLDMHGMLYWDAVGGLAAERESAEFQVYVPKEFSTASNTPWQRIRKWLAFTGFFVFALSTVLWFTPKPSPAKSALETAQQRPAP